MQLLRADADFRTKAKLIAISKACRSIDINSCRINSALEELRRRIVLGNDALAVSRTKLSDMLHRLLDTVHNLYGQAQIAILRRPILLCCRMHLTAVLLHSLVTAHLYAGGIIYHQHHRQEFVSNILMHQQRFHSIAHRRTLHLGIEGNLRCHLHIGSFVDIGMAYACTGLDNRHARITHHSLNQSCAATRNNHIHKAVHMNKVGHSLTVTGIDKLNCASRNAVSLRSYCQNRSHSLVRLHRLAATLKDNSVAGFQAQACCVRRNIRTRFVNNADNTERHTHLGNLQAVRQRFAVQHIANRVRQIGHLPQTVCHAGHALCRQLQPVEHRAAHTLSLCSLHIACIRRQNLLRLFLQRRRHRQKRRILYRRTCNSQLRRSLLRCLRLAQDQFIRFHLCHRLTK